MALHSLNSGQRGRAGKGEGGSHFFLLARVSGCYPEAVGQDHRLGLGTGNRTTMVPVRTTLSCK